MLARCYRQKGEYIMRSSTWTSIQTCYQGQRLGRCSSRIEVSALSQSLGLCSRGNDSSDHYCRKCSTEVGFILNGQARFNHLLHAIQDRPGFGLLRTPSIQSPISIFAASLNGYITCYFDDHPYTALKPIFLLKLTCHVPARQSKLKILRQSDNKGIGWYVRVRFR